MNIVVFGTSIMWGQGLEESDKIHSVLARMVQQRYPDQQVKVTFLAHSGASTGFKADGSLDTHREPRIDGEVPTLYPTVVQEIEEFDGLKIAPESIDVVVLDAGINDVHVHKILDPLITPHQIEAQVEIYCHSHMLLLIRQLLDKFKNAQIIMIAYYEFITEPSEEGFVQKLAHAFGKAPGGVIVDAALDVAKGLIKQRLLTNCDTFSESSLAAFQKTAAELNAQMSGKPRVFVARPDFRPEHSAFTDDPWLFGVRDDLTPEDSLAAQRAQACAAAGERADKIFCKSASIAHPNPKGAKAYAEAIFKLL